MGNKYEKALIYATSKHSGQKRKDGSPYILHPIKVALQLKEAGYNETYQIAGLFHDLLEDTDAAEEEISEYGEEILEAVKLVTKNDCKDNPDFYIDRILKNQIAAAIKNADRIDNLRDACKCNDLAFMQKYLSNSSIYYKGRFSEELDNCIQELENEVLCLQEKNKPTVDINIENPELSFYYVTGPILFCTKNEKQAWVYDSKRKGWIECPVEDVLWDYEYELIRVTKEWVKDYLNKS